jgi:hypothetical protein
MKILEVNAQTNEQIEREATEQEIAQSKIDAETQLSKESAAKTRANAKAALLERLEISADEARLLIS